MTPIQAKRYVANHFRQNSKVTNFSEIDYLVQHGYEVLYEAEMMYSNTGYLFKYIMPYTHKMRDMGVNRLNDSKRTHFNQQEPTKFLKGFYQGKKSHDV